MKLNIYSSWILFKLDSGLISALNRSKASKHLFQHILASIYMQNLYSTCGILQLLKRVPSLVVNDLESEGWLSAKMGSLQ